MRGELGSVKRIGVVGIPGAWSSERLADAVESKTGSRCLIDLARVSLDLQRQEVRLGDLALSDLDAIIVKKVGRSYHPGHLDRLEMLRFLSSRGVPVFSRPERIMRVIDRMTCTVTLRLHQIPMPSTVITESLEEALDAVRRFERAVLKPLFTSKARGMRVVEAGTDALDAVEEFRSNGNPVIYVQQLIDLPGRDLGVAFLGGEYLATYARVGSGDSWNTTIHSNGRYQGCKPDESVIELARRAQAPFGLDFTCVDVVESDGSPMVFEVSAFGGFRGLWEAHGIDAAERYANYVMGKIDGAWNP
jgi:ribosomal protein S6--L-glutamate ligase